MHLFNDYLQPITLWLYDHPQWALTFTFLISFSESLAIIGSIIPGSITMTAIGILAGSGIMRIDLTLLCATLGAIAGDGASYALGAIFRDRLVDIWPFSKYPSWLNYGKTYFARHGGKSVLIGRFFGPLRSIIPVIAGMLHMNRLQFLVANILSAIGWSILYVMPGVLIGAASHELSPNSATNLFITTLVILALLWLASICIKWLFILINNALKKKSVKLWNWFQKHPSLASAFNKLVPEDEVDHYPTFSLLFLFLFFGLMTLVIIVLIFNCSYISKIDYICYLFAQSFRTEWFDIFFIVVRLCFSKLTLACLIAGVSLVAIVYRDWRTLRYWLNLSGVSFLIVYIIWLLIPNKVLYIDHHVISYLPILDLTFATILFGFLTFYIRSHYRSISTLIFKFLIYTFLLFAGFSIIYLGDNWLSNVILAYFSGITISLFFWMCYRRQNQIKSNSHSTLYITGLIILFSSLLSMSIFFKKQVRVHKPYLHQYVISHKAWLRDINTLLPIYSKNRIGQSMSLFNIQYQGSLNKLQASLEAQGWTKQSNSFFYALLIRAGGKTITHGGLNSIKTELYLNKRPTLIMNQNQTTGKPQVVLRVWRSNYYLQHSSKPIWLGSIQPAKELNAILPSLNGYTVNKRTLPDKHHDLLIIEENQ